MRQVVYSLYSLKKERNIVLYFFFCLVTALSDACMYYVALCQYKNKNLSFDGPLYDVTTYLLIFLCFWSLVLSDPIIAGG